MAESMKMPKIIIFGNQRRQFVTEAIEEFTKFVADRAEIVGNCSRGQCLTDVLRKADYAVVFGGDGTILSAARDLSETDIPVIGVNVGKLGFLAEFSLDELKQLFDRATNEKALIEKRMMLSCTVTGSQGHKLSSAAINDIVINAGPPYSMLDLKITINGQALADCIGDGLIISTPTGSTAYNLSAGGPIISADLSAIVITPICPHSLSFRPIVISDDSKVEIYSKRINDGSTVMMDGQVFSELKTDDVITVEKHKNALRVVNNPLRTQWDTLAGKLSWAEKPKYKK